MVCIKICVEDCNHFPVAKYNFKISIICANFIINFWLIYLILKIKRIWALQFSSVSFLTDLKPMFISVHPENAKKTRFQTFSGDAEMERWPEIG